MKIVRWIIIAVLISGGLVGFVQWLGIITGFYHPTADAVARDAVMAMAIISMGLAGWLIDRA